MQIRCSGYFFQRLLLTLGQAENYSAKPTFSTIKERGLRSIRACSLAAAARTSMALHNRVPVRLEHFEPPYRPTDSPAVAISE